MGESKCDDSESEITICFSAVDKELFGFNVEVNSFGFLAENSCIWSERDDLIKFANDLKRLTDHKEESIMLTAIDEFRIDVVPTDTMSHFVLKCHLERIFYDISSDLRVHLSTQVCWIWRAKFYY